MLTEMEMERLLRDPMIKGAAKRVIHAPIGTSHAAGSADRALSMWIAVLTHQFLHSIHAASNPLVEKVWTFAKGRADIDMRVGVNGFYRKFKIETSMTGPTSFKLQIRSWHHGPGGSGMSGGESLWVRYGAFRGQGDLEGIDTLPLH
jgi:hypothetical protein